MEWLTHQIARNTRSLCVPRDISRQRDRLAIVDPALSELSTCFSNPDREPSYPFRVHRRAIARVAQRYVHIRIPYGRHASRYDASWQTHTIYAKPTPPQSTTQHRGMRVSEPQALPVVPQRGLFREFGKSSTIVATGPLTFPRDWNVIHFLPSFPHLDVNPALRISSYFRFR